jgi:hypothetical protein
VLQGACGWAGFTDGGSFTMASQPYRDVCLPDVDAAWSRLVGSIQAARLPSAGQLRFFEALVDGDRRLWRSAVGPNDVRFPDENGNFLPRSWIAPDWLLDLPEWRPSIRNTGCPVEATSHTRRAPGSGATSARRRVGFVVSKVQVRPH